MPDLPCVRFTAAELDEAADEWGANCGPGALAVMTGRTLEQARDFLHGFDRKRYTNPMMMFGALRGMGVEFTPTKPAVWPSFGLSRIQWHGPWMDEGRPVRARYRHTHWVGTVRFGSDVQESRYVFDINAVHETGGWLDVLTWSRELVPWLLEHCEPKADGQWSVTHGLELVKEDR